MSSHATDIQYEHVCHVPLRVRCAMLRKQSPVDPVLSCLSCFRKPSVGVCQVVSNSPDQELRGRPRGFVQTSDGGSKRIWLASVDSFIRAIWPKRDRRRVLTTEESEGCWVAWRTLFSSCKYITFTWSHISHGHIFWRKWFNFDSSSTVTTRE